MFSLIMEIYNKVIFSLSGGDPVAKGLVTVWLLSTVGYVSRSIPSKMYDLFLHLFTVRMSFSSNGDHGDPNMMFYYVENWFITNTKWKMRQLAHIASDSKKEKLSSFANGRHWVLIGRRIFIIEKLEITTKGTESPEFRLYVSTMGRDTAIMENIVKENEVRKDIRYYYIYESNYSKNAWRQQDILAGVQKIFLTDKIKEKLDREIIFFRDNKEWYVENNVPYKLTIVLYGEPGTGKTSLVRYISDLLNSDIYSLNLSSIGTERFELTMRESREGVLRVVSIEDFEKYAAKRKGDAEETDEDGNRIQHVSPGVTLDVLLNTLQGVHPLENIITVLTTNHLELVDPAVIRKGRTDLLIEIGCLDLKQVQAYYEHCYMLTFPPDIIKIKPIKACDMYDLFRSNPQSPEGFISDLKDNYTEVAQIISIEKQSIQQIHLSNSHG